MTDIATTALHQDQAVDSDFRRPLTKFTTYRLQTLAFLCTDRPLYIGPDEEYDEARIIVCIIYLHTSTSRHDSMC